MTASAKDAPFEPPKAVEPPTGHQSAEILTKNTDSLPVTTHSADTCTNPVVPSSNPTSTDNNVEISGPTCSNMSPTSSPTNTELNKILHKIVSPNSNVQVSEISQPSNTTVDLTSTSEKNHKDAVVTIPISCLMSAKPLISLIVCIHELIIIYDSIVFSAQLFTIFLQHSHLPQKMNRKKEKVNRDLQLF